MEENKFKVGDWVVSLEKVGRHRDINDVFQVKGVSGSQIWYKEHICGNYREFRHAELHEIPIIYKEKQEMAPYFW